MESAELIAAPAHHASAASRPKILFVDDDANILAALGRTMRAHFAFDTALGGEEALRLLASNGPYAVVLADMTMPGMSGVELLERVRERSPDTIPMMLTGNADQPTAVESVNRARVFRFLNKPCPGDTLSRALEAALHEYELKRTERELLEGTLTGCVKLLTDVLGTVAPDALGRGQRLRLAIGYFARQRALPPVWECEVAALLSSIGVASVPPGILEKLACADDLSVVEQEIIRRAPQAGHDLLCEIPRLAPVAKAVLYQHKNYDGSGFPEDGCAGESIPLAARLLRIFGDRLELEADGVVKDRALAAMRERKGYYDPVLLDECFKVYPAFLPSALASDRPVSSVSIDDLEAGQVLVSDISTREGVAIVGAGHVLTAMIIQRVRNFAALDDVKEPILVQAALEPVAA